MKSLLFLFFLVPFALFAQQTFTITGQIAGLEEGSGVSLSDPNNPGDTLASGNVQNGQFVLKGKIDEANLYQLNMEGAQKKSILFIGNEQVKVKGDASAAQDLAISGSSTHADFEEFKKIFNPLFHELNTQGQTLKATPNVSEEDPKVVTYMDLLTSVRTEVDKFVRKHRNSPVAPFVVVVTSEMEQDFETLQKRYALLDKKVRDGFYGKIVKEQLDSRVGSVGSQAIEFSQLDQDGKPVSLSSFRGKYVLVDFWASWCRPCRDENPNVVNAYNKFKDKNFTVLGVSLDNNKQPWLKAIKADKLNWTQVSDLLGWNNAAAAKYKIQSIPQNILVDPDGKIIAKNLRGQELHQKLGELLNN